MASQIRSGKEGVEEFAGLSMDELWAILGVMQLPFFNERYDLLNGKDGWSDEETAVLHPAVGGASSSTVAPTGRHRQDADQCVCQEAGSADG